MSVLPDRGPVVPDEPPALRIRWRPGDLGWIVHRHGVLYARECGFDQTFEAYVARPLADFAGSASGRERIWVAEQGDRIVGCIAVVAATPETAQLRWFLVEPDARGRGLGRRLLEEALGFCRASGYGSVVLWTVRALTAAAHLYRAAGFEKVEERPGQRWGAAVIEEKYRLPLAR